jgi:hypothetical protein
MIDLVKQVLNDDRIVILRKAELPFESTLRPQ